jgi:hypothetical protein
MNENTNKQMTIATVNAALKKAGKAERFMRGRGYFYFVGPDTAGWPTSSVYVHDVNQLSLKQWLEVLETLRPKATEQTRSLFHLRIGNRNWEVKEV